jgi:opacity protein-like surface antigen
MISAAVAALTMTAPSAQAADAYVSLFGGGSFLSKPNFNGANKTHSTYFFQSTQSVDTSFKTGYVLGGAFGVDWGNIRTELELGYRHSKSSKTARLKTSYAYNYTTFADPQAFSTSRDEVVSAGLNLSSWSLMANAWYDFHDVLPFGLTPYAGGGLGFAQVKLSGMLDGIKLHEKDATVFAWQLGGGVSLPISDGMKLFADYRYFAADSVPLKIQPGFHGGSVNADYDSHSVLLGLRVNL